MSAFLNDNWLPYTQTFHPYYFGDGYYKRTCFWLKNLPPLIYGPYANPSYKLVNASSNKRHGKKLPMKANNAKDRARFHPKVAQAMADQWGAFLMSQLDTISTSGS